MATRAVNKIAKEGEQNARLLLSRGALSAMAIFRRGAFPSVRRWRCTAPYPRCSSQPRQNSVFRASDGETFSKSCLRRRFYAGRAAVIWCGANPGVRPWQDLRECVLGRLAVAIFSRGAFSSALPWQDSAAVRSRASIRGRFCAPCIPKAASGGKIASSRQDSRAMHPKTGWPWQDMRAMHPKCPANRRWRIRRANILPGRGTFRCTGPSNHASRENIAIRRRRSALAPATPVPPTSAKPPERPRPRHRRTARAARARSPDPRNTAQEAAPPVASWAASTANSPRGTATAL